MNNAAGKSPQMMTWATYNSPKLLSNVQKNQEKHRRHPVKQQVKMLKKNQQKKLKNQNNDVKKLRNNGKI